MAGKISDDLWGTKFNVDFYDLKGVLENIAHDLKFSACKYVAQTQEPFLHPGQSCSIYIKNQRVGYLGRIHPDVMEKMDLKGVCYLFEINIDILDALLTEEIRYKEISKFPAVTRDVAFVIPLAMEADQILEIVSNQHEDLLENVGIFDIYTGKGLDEGSKSLGLRFSYRASDRTLTDTEINALHEKIVQNTMRLTGAKIRA
jgi:phenylalanyl-tRNA synthetase beta chain